MGKSKKKSNTKKRNNLRDSEPSDLVQAPHTFVIHRGLPCEYIIALTRDFRRIMQPFTAQNLHERRTNRIKDFVNMSSYFHVSHMVIFSKAATQLSFKIMRFPRGPTLTFKVHKFTLARDVLSTNKRQYVGNEVFKNAPLVIMNNFSAVEGRHMKLMANTLQNMFPAINLAQVNISTIRRCVLFSYGPLTNSIEMRHYSTQIVPVGLSKSIKKLVFGKIPNMSNCEDIADFIVEDDSLSESEVENDVESQVLLPQTFKCESNIENNKSAIKLYEIGPRLTLQLIKIEDNLQTGEVLYHNHITRTAEEKEMLRKVIEKKQKLKEQRRKIQLKNRQRKINVKQNKEETEKDELDDDIAYYKEEVGVEPDTEIFRLNRNTGNKRPKCNKKVSHTEEVTTKKVRISYK